MRISDWSSDVCSSTFESVDNGMPQRSLISLSVQPLRARSERSRLPIVGCCEVIARGFLRFVRVADVGNAGRFPRSEEHTSELQSLMRISYAVFCLNKKKHKILKINQQEQT